MLRPTFTNLFRTLKIRNVYRKCDAINTIVCRNFIRCEHDDTSVTKLFQPAPIKEYAGDNIGMQLVGELKSNEVLRVLDSFKQQKKIALLCREYKIDGMCLRGSGLTRDINTELIHLQRFCKRGR